MLSTQAQAQDNVSLRLNWYLGGLHVPFYYGVDRGFYRQEGINLTINEGRGSANTVQVVGAGTDTFGLADSSSIINLVSKGGEIKSVMNILSSNRLFSGLGRIGRYSHAQGHRRQDPGRLAWRSDPRPARSPGSTQLRSIPARSSLCRSTRLPRWLRCSKNAQTACSAGPTTSYFLLKYRGVEPHALRFA